MIGVQYPEDKIVIIKDPMAHFSKRPSMYIGKRSLYGLECFVAGAMTAENIARVDKSLFGIDWDDFELWVNKKARYKYRRKSFDIARMKAKQDDEVAFDLWMKWYEEYKDGLQGERKPVE